MRDRVRARKSSYLASAVLLALFSTACAEGTESGQETASPTSSSVSTTSSDGDPSATDSSTTTPTTTSSTTTTTTEAPPELLCGLGSNDPGIDVPTSWDVGEQRNIEVLLERTDPRPGRSGGSSTPFTLTVLEANEQGTTFEWLAGETDLSTLGIPDTAAFDGILDRFPRERIVYEVDSFGVFGAVQNIEEIRDNTISSLDLLLEIDPSGEETFAQVRALFTSMDALALTTMFAERPMIFHAFDGILLEEGDSYSVSDMLPNALGGEPFPATSTISHEPGADEEGCEAIVIRTTPDPAQFGKILFETIGTAFASDIDTAEATADIGEFAAQNVVTLRFDNSANRVRQVTATQEITVDGETRLDKTTMTDVTPQ